MTVLFSHNSNGYTMSELRLKHIKVGWLHKAVSDSGQVYKQSGNAQAVIDYIRNFNK